MKDIITMIMWLCKINYSKKSYRSRVLIKKRYLCSEAPDIAMNGWHKIKDIAKKDEIKRQ